MLLYKKLLLMTFGTTLVQFLLTFQILLQILPAKKNGATQFYCIKYNMHRRQQKYLNVYANAFSVEHT
jgi:hypothetical protein